MKTPTTLTLALLLASGSFLTAEPATTAATPSQPAYAYVVRNADFDGWTISRGMSRKRLISKCGQPDAKITDSIWIYRAFHSVPDKKNAPVCTNLMVTLSDGVVADLHLINETTMVAVAANPHAVSKALLASTP